MGTPAQHLPPAFPEDTIQALLTSLHLPAARTITPLRVTAEYHAIYLLTFPPHHQVLLHGVKNNHHHHHHQQQQQEDRALGSPGPQTRRAPDDSTTLVLRVSGRHLPRSKTINEVAVMTWVRANTTIPVPAVVRFDASEANPLGYEFTLLEAMPGVSVDGVYDQLDASTKHALVSQLADLVAELHSHHEWKMIGGLQFADGHIKSSSSSSSNDQSSSGEAVKEEEEDEEDEEDAGKLETIPGPVLDETLWQEPDIRKFWPQETAGVASSPLNIAGPYDGAYTALVAAQIGTYIYAVERHDSLAWMRDLVPRLRRLVDTVLRTTRTKTSEKQEEGKEELNNMKLVLAHKDLHFGNVMFDPATARITAILDWEFAGVVPACRWNPARAFLWSGKYGEEAKTEKEALMEVFAQMCEERGIAVLADARMNARQEAMQTVVSYVRALVEVCPRGEKEAAAKGWRKTVEEALDKWDV